MSEYEYEKLECMTVGQVVDAIDNGDKFYAFEEADKECEINFDLFGFRDIKKLIKLGYIYTRKEKPWWEGCEGSVIMVRDFDDDLWCCDVFEEFIDGSGYGFNCVGAQYKQARPLTTAERDAIKVQD